MTEQEILDGNKLIAEFMGSKAFKTMPELLEYHTSWDWLMPVVEKIGMIRGVSLGIPFGAMRIHFTGLIGNTSVNKLFYACEPQLTWLQCCHKAVVDFIKWYNQQSK